MTDRWMIRRSDPQYPVCLANTDHPPDRLYGIGDPDLLTEGLAVVGSRRATPYGLSCASMFAGWAAQAGIVVISGAALGCDCEAHRSALAVGGNTLAVLGCGADVDYPRSCAGLIEQIREKGCVVSEFEWGTAPTRWAFPRRNRIIAGLARAVLVVEASLPSGTFSTADHALDASRLVLAVPGSIHSPECRGSNRLLCQGATPITDVSDLAAALGLLGEGDTSDCGVDLMSSEGDAVLRAIRADPMRPDDIGRHLVLDIVTVSRRLGELERMGLAKRYRDGRYGGVIPPSRT